MFAWNMNMNTKLVYAMVGIVAILGVLSTSTVTIPIISAVSDEACANQMDRQDRFQDKFEDYGNPNNDKGNEESWTNSFKNREPC
jgi:hypothetical protein